MKETHHALAAQFAQALRSARETRGWTQAEAAERAGIAMEVYGRLERGRTLPRADTLARLAVVLHVSADALLGIAEAGSALLPEQVRTAEAEEAYALSRPELRRLARRLQVASPRTLRLLDLLLAAIFKDAQVEAPDGAKPG